MQLGGKLLVGGIKPDCFRYLDRNAGNRIFIGIVNRPLRQGAPEAVADQFDVVADDKIGG